MQSHDELLGNRWLHPGVTANVHDLDVRMQGIAVGLYCAVVDRLDLLVSTRPIAACEIQGVFNQRAGMLRKWLGALNLGSGEGWQRQSE